MTEYLRFNLLFFLKTLFQIQYLVLYLCLSSFLASCSSNTSSQTLNDQLSTQTNTIQAHGVQETLSPKTVIAQAIAPDSTHQVQRDQEAQENNRITCLKKLTKNFSKTSNSRFSPPNDSSPSSTQNNKTITHTEADSTSPTRNTLNNDDIISEQELPCDTQPEQPPFGLVMISKVRSSIGANFLKLSRSMDSIFSGDDSADFSKNESHLRLSTQATYFENGRFDQDVSLKAKLDLPKTTNRLQLFFDSRFEEDESLEERKTTASSGERVNRRESVAGLEYDRNKKGAKWRYGIRLGTRTGLPLKLFTRLRVERRWAFSDVFSAKFQQDFWYLDGTGLGETTYFDLKTIINERFYLLNETEIQYEDDTFPISYYHAINVFHRISDKSRIRYRLGAVGTDDENAFIDQYFANISFTYRLYKEWLFVSVIPEIIFRGEFQTDNEFREDPMPVPNDFKPWKPEASFTLKFDIFSN